MSLTSALDAIPPVTRFLLVATAATTLPCLLGLVHPSQVALSWWRVSSRYEVWRPLTAFFFGGSGFPLIYDVFVIYRNSSSLEAATSTADYAWTHIMLAVFVLLLNTLLDLPFLFRPLLHAQNYLWCRANPTMSMSLFGLLTIPTSFYPPALIVLDLLTGGPDKALGGVIGLVAGHSWWFVSSYLPIKAPRHLRRSNPLSTPMHFRSLFATQGNRTNQPAQSMPSGPATAAYASGHTWGSGQRLGGQGL